MNESVIDIFKGSVMPIEGQTPFTFTYTDIIYLQNPISTSSKFQCKVQ